jgi:hypothetical protein
VADDDFTVASTALNNAAASFGRSTGSVKDVGTTMEGGGVDTGDASLNADIQSVADLFKDIYANFGKVLERVSAGLNEAVSVYQDLDAEMADAYNQLAPQGPQVA